jgi:hypothetical protein
MLIIHHVHLNIFFIPIPPQFVQLLQLIHSIFREIVFLIQGTVHLWCLAVVKTQFIYTREKETEMFLITICFAAVRMRLYVFGDHRSVGDAVKTGDRLPDNL